MRKLYIITMLCSFFITIQACKNDKKDVIAELTESNMELMSMEQNTQKLDLHVVLKTLGTRNQPSNSKVCWAVCLANIHNGIYPDRKLTYCEILGSEGDRCIMTDKEEPYIHDDYDKDIKPEKLKMKADSLDLNLEKFAVIDLKDFNKVRELLETQKVPIIFQENYGEYTHLKYIFGYVIDDNCKFYSIFDPLPGYEGHLLKKSFDSLIDDGHILNAWYPNIPSKNNKISVNSLNKDSVLAEIKNKIEEFHTENTQYKDLRNSTFDNPNNYLVFPKLELGTLQKETALEEYRDKLLRYWSTETALQENQNCFMSDEYLHTRDSNIKNMINSLYTNENLETLLPKNNTYTIENESSLTLDFSLKNGETFYTLTVDNETKALEMNFDIQQLKNQLQSYQEK